MGIVLAPDLAGFRCLVGKARGSALSWASRGTRS